MKKQIKSILCIVIILSLLVSGYIGVKRVNVENNYKDVQISIRYSDVLNIAQQTDTSVEEVLKTFKEAGATNLFVRENTVAPNARGEMYNYKEQGKANYYEGYILEKFYPEATNIERQYTYIETFDKGTLDKIYYNLATKNVPAEKVDIAGKTFIQIGSATAAVVTTGVGFNYEDLRIAAELGYSVSPQVKSWQHSTEESVDYLVEQIRMIPNLDTIYFADSDVSEFKSEAIVELVDEAGLGFVEFFSGKQKGFNNLAYASMKVDEGANVSRLHTLTDGEARGFGKAKIMDRFMLAITERNLRTFLFKMPNTIDIEADATFMLDCINTFKNKVEAQGFIVTNDVAPYNLPNNGFIMIALVGIAAVGMFILLLDKLALTKVGYILGILGLVGYVGLLKLSPSMAIKLMALFGSIIFPTYAVLDAVETKPNSLKRTILAFLKMSAISFGGALTIVGTLSRTTYGLGIDIFAGVKFAHILPILLVVGILIYRAYGIDFNFYKKILMSNVTYLAIAVAAIFVVVLGIYTSRTGNTGNVSATEAQFRQLLDTVLGVRPRTKEFLIGHPIMITLLYYGYKEKYLPFLVLGMIGQISLVNTYAHLHTPLMISLTRSAYGLGIGIVIGIILIYVIKFVCKVMNQWKQKIQ